jgi:uncharacterized protein YcnI
MHRAGIARGAVLALLAALLLAAPAAAHVTVQPAASRPGDLQRYTVYVPNEEDSPTTSVAMRVPEGVDFLLVEAAEGWDARVVRRGDVISEVRWTGGDVPPGGYAELHFLARNPVEQGEVAFPAVQTYGSGSVARWIGPADGDNPAPRVELSETATPVDVVSTHGEAQPAEGGSAPGPAAAADAPEAEGSGDGLTLGLAIAALVAALGALGVTLLRR